MVLVFCKLCCYVCFCLELIIKQFGKCFLREGSRQFYILQNFSFVIPQQIRMEKFMTSAVKTKPTVRMIFHIFILITAIYFVFQKTFRLVRNSKTVKLPIIVRLSVILYICNVEASPSQTFYRLVPKVLQSSAFAFTSSFLLASYPTAAAELMSLSGASIESKIVGLTLFTPERVKSTRPVFKKAAE